MPPAKRSSQTAKVISLMLVDDHPMWREILREVLEKSGVAKVVAEAGDGQEAVDRARSVRPDVILMDIELPTMNGVEATRALAADRPGVKVLVLSSSQQRSQVLAAIEAGASGYLLKTANAEEVANAVRRIHAGEVVFPPALTGLVLSEIGRRPVGASDAQASSEAAEGNLFRREGDYWTIAHDGEVFRLRDTKGVRYMRILLSHPGREFHAMDLVAVERGGEGVVEAGHAGEMLDPQAKSAYRRRLTELTEELEEAESWSDAGRAARLRQESDAVIQELARSVGLGGRDRKSASVAERARVNVTLAIKAAMTKIADNAPTLGRHFAATIRTGTFCSYTPDPRVPPSWTV